MVPYQIRHSGRATDLTSGYRTRAEAKHRDRCLKSTLKRALQYRFHAEGSRKKLDGLKSLLICNKTTEIWRDGEHSEWTNALAGALIDDVPGSFFFFLATLKIVTWALSTQSIAWGRKNASGQIIHTHNSWVATPTASPVLRLLRPSPQLCVRISIVSCSLKLSMNARLLDFRTFCDTS